VTRITGQRKIKRVVENKAPSKNHKTQVFYRTSKMASARLPQDKVCTKIKYIKCCCRYREKK
jgi:hypothetical protein